MWAIGCKDWITGWEVINVLPVNIIQETLQILVFWCHLSIHQVHQELCLKYSFFGRQKMKYLRDHSSNFKNQAHSEILSLRAFSWAIINYFLRKFKFYCELHDKIKMNETPTKIKWKITCMPFLQCICIFQVLKVLLIKICKIQPPNLSFLVLV